MNRSPRQYGVIPATGALKSRSFLWSFKAVNDLLGNGEHTGKRNNSSSSQTVRQGFTLLELSIVLVIIGLLIGGIFVGQSLIHTAQLNAVISEFNRYQTAVQTFKQQYQALPGDMNNATSFWGIAGGTGADATCQNTVATTAATCNGNGDGVIAPYVVPGDEGKHFWQHLANAKMIEGSYTGAGTATVGVNMPASRYGNALSWRPYAGSAWTGGDTGGGWFNADYGTGHVMMFSLASGYSGITPKDVWAIDKKYDDGKPGLGNVLVYNWAGCTNAASMNDFTATYTLTVTTASCALFFLSSF